MKGALLLLSEGYIQRDCTQLSTMVRHMYCNQQYSLCSIISVIASIINTLLICMHLNRK